MHSRPSRGFTLIELLVVIAIIAVLSVVVVLSLNPAELLRQSRDANRLSDLSTLNSALALYTTDQAGIAGFSLGNASSVYVSLPDSSSTCGTWSLPTLPAGYTYACSTSTSSKNINTTGWIPVNFSNISGGAPFSNLPIDNVDQSSTGLYYVYYSNGSQFELTAIPESQKQKAALGAKSIIQNYPEVLANGSSMTISPLFSTNGLVGYWPMDEGAGTITADLSGNSFNGTLTTGTGGLPIWTTGKVGGALSFDTTQNYVQTNQVNAFNMGTSDFTLSGFVYQNNSSCRGLFEKRGSSMLGYLFIIGYPSAGQATIFLNDTSTQKTYSISNTVLSSSGAWYQILIVVSRTSNTATFYINGNFVQSVNISATSGSINGDGSLRLAYDSGGCKFNGLFDDVRVYNRALSPAEIQAIYNAER